MADAFDPYFKWLGILPEEQPAHHYRLLSVPLFVADADVISNAADRQMAHLRTFQTGPHSAASQQLLNEIAAARLCLLSERRKAEYDQQLKAKLSPPLQKPAQQQPTRQPVPQQLAPVQPAQMLPMGLPLPKAVATPVRSAEPANAYANLGLDSSADQSRARGKRSKSPASWKLPAILGAAIVVLVICIALVRSFKPQVTAAKNGTQPAEKNPPPGSAPIEPKSPPVSVKRSPAQPKPAPPSQPTPKPAPVIVAPPMPAGPDVTVVITESPDTKPAPDANSVPDAKPTAPQPAQAAFAKDIPLLDVIDLEEDVVAGEWKREGRALISPNTWGARVYLPAPPTRDYSVTAEVQRREGNEDFWLGLVVGDRQVLAYSGKSSELGRTGLGMIEGEDKYEVSRYGPEQTLNQSSTMTCSVRGNHITVQINGSTIIDWTGDPNRLSVWPDAVMTDKTRLFVGAHSSYRITRLSMTPLGGGPPAAASRPIGKTPADEDLLKLVDLQRDIISQVWKFENGALVSPRNFNAGIQLPIRPAADYRLSITAQRVSGNDALMLWLPVGDRNVMACIDLHRSQRCGLGKLDGQHPENNTAQRRGAVMTTGDPYEIVYTVEGNRIHVTVAGQTVIDWTGDFKRLSVEGYGKLPDRTRPNLATHSSFRFTRLSCTPAEVIQPGER